jgi:hypothetical protein
MPSPVTPTAIDPVQGRRATAAPRLDALPPDVPTREPAKPRLGGPGVPRPGQARRRRARPCSTPTVPAPLCSDRAHASLLRVRPRLASSDLFRPPPSIPSPPGHGLPPLGAARALTPLRPLLVGAPPGHSPPPPSRRRCLPCGRAGAGGRGLGVSSCLPCAQAGVGGRA